VSAGPNLPIHSPRPRAALGHEYAFPPHRPNAPYVIEKETVASIKLIGATAWPERSRIGVDRVGFWHDSEATVAGRRVRFLGYSGRVLARPSGPPLALGCRAGMSAFTGSLGG